MLIIIIIIIIKIILFGINKLYIYDIPISFSLENNLINNNE